MGELQQQLPAGVSSTGEPIIPNSKQPESPAPSDKTVTAPPVSSNDDIKQQPQPGRRAAIFSTDLCRRPPRGLQQLGCFQPIVRSNLEEDAYVAAGRLRKKYPYQYLSIFPHQGWLISDFWDDHDIQIEGKNYSTAVLNIIANHNAIQVPQFAREYAEKHPERLNLIGGNIAGLYDKSDPLSIVDKIFVNGETRGYPPAFLWKVAYVLRTKMLAVKAISEPPKHPVSDPARSDADQQDLVVHSAEHAPASVTAPAKVPVATSTASKGKTQSVSTHHEIMTSTSAAPAPLVKPAPTMPDTQAASTQHQEGHFARTTADPLFRGRFGPPAASSEGLGHTGPMGHMIPVVPVHHAGGPNMTHTGVHNPRTRAGRSASGSHSQIMPSSPYVENMSRVSSGYVPRQYASAMSAAHSPQFHPAHMAMNHHMGNLPPNMMSFGYNQDPMGPGAMAGQPQPGFMHPGAMPHHAMQGPPMMQAYPRQPSNMQGPPLTIPMGEMTNMQYGGPPRMPFQNMGPRRRLSQQHSNGSTLYDPYEGNNPAFRNAGYPNGKKYNQSSTHNNNGRPRKPSFPGSRPYHGQYPNARPQAGGRYNYGPKSHMDNDPSITQDLEFGCFVDWIGPLNEIVNELFVKDLPENIQPTELEDLFQAQLGVKLTSVNIRCSPQAPQLKHAFVGFPTCAITKQALVIPNPTIRGYPVSITVPKRFFQNTADIPSRDTIEAVRDRASSIQEGSDVTSSTAATKEKTSYSPQDARSDLPKKKKKGKQTQQAQVTAGSPEARKVKPKKQRQESPMKEEPAVSTEPTVSAATGKTDDLNDSAKVEGPASASMTVKPIVSTVSKETEQLQVNEKTTPPTPTVVKTLDAKPAGTEVVASEPDTVDRVSKAAPSKILPAVPVEPTVEPAMTSLPQPKTTTATKVPATASTPLEVQDPTSDDELKNDSSFHPAAESQSELEVKGVPNIGPGAANHEIDVQVPETSTATSIPTPAPPASTTHSTQEAVNAPTEEVAVTTDTGNPQTEQESKTTTMPSTTSEAAEVQAATQQETKKPTTTTVVVGQTKKRGPQQPEAFYQGPKQLARQAKKEREKQKKADRKAEKLAKQGKGEGKIASDQAPPADGPSGTVEGATNKTDAPKDETKSVGDVQSVDTTATTPTTTPDTKETSASSEKLTPTETSQKTVDDGYGTSGKGKGKKAVTSAAEELASTEDKKKDHGKQTNGTSVTPEARSVTNKEEKSNSEEILQETSTKETAQKGAPGSDAQSSKQDGSKEVTSDGQESGPSGSGKEGSTPSTKKRKNKKKKKNTEGETSKQPLAWPNLDFRPRSPNPVWMGPIDMETDVHNYDKIMDEACGGPDDSDFSWADLPVMEDVLNSDQDEAPAGSDGGSGPSPSVNSDEERQMFNALFPKLKKLRPKKGAESYARLSETSTMEEMTKLATDGAALVAKVDAATRPSQQFKDAADDELGNAYLSITAAPAPAKEEMKLADAVVAANGKQHAESATGHDPSDSSTPYAQPPKKKKANKHNNKKKKKKAADDGEPSQSRDAIATTATVATPSKASVDPVDPSDPFARQLNHVDAVIDLNQNGAAVSGSVSLRDGAATPTEELTFKRAVEAYFREAHPERRRSAAVVIFQGIVRNVLFKAQEDGV
ncbi:hypothetical protein E8E11_010224 [Didymella keratinophila]|nr:hypothetical protein E8E11_010224 [Didymella keratinophila]